MLIPPQVEKVVLGMLVGHGLVAPEIVGRRVGRHDGLAFYHLCVCHPCIYPAPSPYLCPCLYPYPSPGHDPFPGRRRTSIWVAFGCASLATETAEKSGETVLPSYVACPGNTTCHASPFRC